MHVGLGVGLTTPRRTGTAAAWAPASWSTLAGWWDPDDASTVFSDTEGTTPATAGTDDVARINDKVGTTHLTQSTSGNRPAYANDAGVSRKVIDFTLANSDRMSASSASVATVATGNDNGWAIVAAVKRGTAGVSVRTFTFGHTSSGNMVTCFISSANALGVQKISPPSTTSTASTTATATSDAWYIMSWVHSGTTITCRVNGSQSAAASNDVGSLTLSTFNLGSDQNGAGAPSVFFDGSLGEWFVSDDTSVTTDITSAEAYLAAKYGITLS